MPGHCLGYLSEPLESRRAVPPPCVRPQVAAEDEATAHAAVQSIDDMVLDAHNYDARSHDEVLSNVWYVVNHLTRQQKHDFDHDLRSRDHVEQEVYHRTMAALPPPAEVESEASAEFPPELEEIDEPAIQKSS